MQQLSSPLKTHARPSPFSRDSRLRQHVIRHRAANLTIQNQRHNMPHFFTQLADLLARDQQMIGRCLAVRVSPGSGTDLY